MRTIGLRYLTGICLAGLFCLSSAFGQTVTGSITGEVTDPSGAVVVGATVTAENTATSVKTTAQTNSVGVYSIRFLPVGTYKLSIDATGFIPTSVPGFAMEINQTAKINVTMTIGASTTVVVQEQIHPILDTTDSTVGNTISSNEIAKFLSTDGTSRRSRLFQPGAIDTDPQGMTGNNAIERKPITTGSPRSTATAPRRTTTRSKART